MNTSINITENNTSKTRSFIWKILAKDFSNAVNKSQTWTDLGKIFYKNKTNLRTIKNRVKKDKLSTAHFLGRSKYKNRQCKHNSHPRYTTNSLLQNDPSHKIPNQRLKEKLFNECLLINQCYSCGINDTWNNKPLILRLVHLDGNSYNNNLLNLIIQCPNCFSQLQKKKVIFVTSCCKCGQNIPLKRNKCVLCCHRKCTVPSKEILQKELIAFNFSGVQKKYGIDREEIIQQINR